VTDGSYRDVGATGDWKVVEGEEYRSVDGADRWLALAGKLYRTTDEGRNWTRIGSDPGWGEVCTMRVSAISLLCETGVLPGRSGCRALRSSQLYKGGSILDCYMLRRVRGYTARWTMEILGKWSIRIGPVGA